VFLAAAVWAAFLLSRVRIARIHIIYKIFLLIMRSNPVLRLAGPRGSEEQERHRPLCCPLAAAALRRARRPRDARAGSAVLGCVRVL
jgi:hypothetical protein